MNNTTIKRSILQAALQLLADPDAWTEGAFARDAYGGACDPTSSLARRWCAEGALQKCARDWGVDVLGTEFLVDEISIVCTGAPDGLIDLNDRSGYEPMISAMRQGLARLVDLDAQPVTAPIVRAKPPRSLTEIFLNPRPGAMWMSDDGPDRAADPADHTEVRPPPRQRVLETA
jgi:hypothetical protein